MGGVYSLGSCAVGQTDGRVALFQNAPYGEGHKNGRDKVAPVYKDGDRARAPPDTLTWRPVYHLYDGFAVA